MSFDAIRNVLKSLPTNIRTKNLTLVSEEVFNFAKTDVIRSTYLFAHLVQVGFRDDDYFKRIADIYHKEIHNMDVLAISVMLGAFSFARYYHFNLFNDLTDILINKIEKNNDRYNSVGKYVHIANSYTKINHGNHILYNTICNYMINNINNINILDISLMINNLNKMNVKNDIFYNKMIDKIILSNNINTIDICCIASAYIKIDNENKELFLFLFDKIKYNINNFNSLGISSIIYSINKYDEKYNIENNIFYILCNECIYINKYTLQESVTMLKSISEYTNRYNYIKKPYIYENNNENIYYKSIYYILNNILSIIEYNSNFNGIRPQDMCNLLISIDILGIYEIKYDMLLIYIKKFINKKIDYFEPIHISLMIHSLAQNGHLTVSLFQRFRYRLSYIWEKFSINYLKYLLHTCRILLNNNIYNNIDKEDVYKMLYEICSKIPFQLYTADWNDLASFSICLKTFIDIENNSILKDALESVAADVRRRLEDASESPPRCLSASEPSNSESPRSGEYPPHNSLSTLYS
eukprot:GHVL01042004.1.p1 GENE.GHVL01042004.1~~GHVL01042004.1.p1  ORF type:complete len:539 (+),score=146.43 GHVL01042004.1:45-1619(+)